MHVFPYYVSDSFSAREKDIKKQIEEATKPKQSIVETKSAKKASSPDFIDPAAVYPSIIPEKAFFSTVRKIKGCRPISTTFSMIMKVLCISWSSYNINLFIFLFVY